MNRHYFVTTDLEDLEQVETELESAGIDTSHIHVLTSDAAGAATHHLHTLSDFMQRDVFHSAAMGASLGIMLVMFILIEVSVSGTALRLGWTPLVLLCGALLGFSTWAGGFLGIQRPNHALRRFMGSIRKGRHVLLVDVEERQERALSTVVAHHPALRAAHDGVPG